MEIRSSMRTVWKGSIVFGMVVLPARLFSATEEHRSRFKEIHSADNGKIHHKRVCEVEGPEEEIPYEAVGRAVELRTGSLYRSRTKTLSVCLCRRGTWRKCSASSQVAILTRSATAGPTTWRRTGQLRTVRTYC
ncbi:hypothetical protein AS594_39725 [Streptomyces agglomeratus]|uniref:Ku domain-containing protein n=1 Tax=Streptomyces agglomeratus TaxID=285458 RepID=A0A1E5NZD6_9ACTN|nr:hypothetical protein AS594_39725 [Streptomyces agglomeratus]